MVTEPRDVMTPETHPSLSSTVKSVEINSELHFSQIKEIGRAKISKTPKVNAKKIYESTGALYLKQEFHLITSVSRCLKLLYLPRSVRNSFANCIFRRCNL